MKIKLLNENKIRSAMLKIFSMFGLKELFKQKTTWVMETYSMLAGESLRIPWMKV